MNHECPQDFNLAADIYSEARELAIEGMREHNIQIAKRSTVEERHRRALCGGLANKKKLEDPEQLQIFKQKIKDVHASRSEDQEAAIYQKVSNALKIYYADAQLRDSESYKDRQLRNKQTNKIVSKAWRTDFVKLFGHQPEYFRKFGKLQEACILYKQIKSLSEPEKQEHINIFLKSCLIEEIV